MEDQERANAETEAAAPTAAPGVRPDRHEAQTRLALDAARMGTWRWDRRTNEVVWSPELEMLFGLAPGTFPSTFDAYRELIHPDDRDAVIDSIYDSVARGDDIALVHRVVRPDGRLLWIEGRGHALPGTDNQEWIGVGIDVTERLHAEQAAAAATRTLTEALARLDALLEHAPVGFAFLDADLHFVRINEPLAEIGGLPVETYVGRTPAIVLPVLWPRLKDAFERVQEHDEAVVDIELRSQTTADPGLERSWLASCYPVEGPSGERPGFGLVVVEITERQRVERAAQLLAAAAELFASDLDLDTMLDRVARLAIPDFADSTHLYLVGVDGSGRRVALANRDPALEPRLLEADRRYPIDLDADLPTARALRTGRTQRVGFVSDETRRGLARDADHLEVIEAHGVCSVIATPLQVRGRTLGVLVLTYTKASQRRYRADDVGLAEELARRFAQAIDGARLSEEAERVRTRLDLLASLSELISVELSSEMRLDALARLVLPTFADLCVIHVIDPNGDVRLAAYAAADPSKQALLDALAPSPPSPPDEPVPWFESMTRGEPVLMPSVSQPLDDWFGSGPERRDVTDTIGVRSLLSVPLPGADGPAGSMTFVYAESGRRYGRDDVPLAVELARRTGPGVEHARRFEQEQATAEVLQRSLLPARLPALGSTEFAARYLPGSEELKVGGDWYDVVPLTGGRVLLAIGDVVGHGVRAAASMGRMRNLLEFCAGDGASPGELLTRLNHYFAGSEDADMATLLVGVYEPSSDQLTLASAGHPPPVRRDADGRVELLEGARGAPLGAVDHAEFPESKCTLPLGSVLVLYTDGLVERRGESLDDGFARLAGALSNAPDDLDELADRLLDQLLEGRNPSDDVALLIVRPLMGRNVNEWRFRARPRDLSRLRQALRDWLARVGVASDDAAEAIVATNEAAANAIEHAYGLEPSEFVVEGRYDDGNLTIVVRDTGRWRQGGPDVGRGRGIQLMRGLMDEVLIEPGREGTTVTMRRATKSSS